VSSTATGATHWLHDLPHRRRVRTLVTRRSASDFQVPQACSRHCCCQGCRSAAEQALSRALCGIEAVVLRTVQWAPAPCSCGTVTLQETLRRPRPSECASG
jgi:hypothetical protein